MKRSIVLLSLFLSFLLNGQSHLSYNIQFLSYLNPNNDTTPGNKYSGCWGWHQQSKNREYAISGASNGTYFIDVTNPSSPVVRDFVPGHSICTWRELKTYQNYCYVVSDVCTPNAFQIIDMQYLPDSVHVVHDSGILFDRAHTIWIDKDKMYVGLVKFPGGSSAMAVFSLATPTAPTLLRRIEEDSLNIAEVHDMYVRNDTVYASAGWAGIRVLKLTATNTFDQLGSFSAYSMAGYNHSSYLTQNGKYLLFCDEVPNSLPMHLVNVENLGNIQPVMQWQPAPMTTPHNPYVLGNNIAVVSCYQDGLYVYNISKPDSVSLSGFFDTHPQGGVNTGVYTGGAYRGNWGAYPFLPSGIIIANDMQNGVYILDPTAAYNTTVTNLVGVTGLQPKSNSLVLYPNPASDKVRVNYAGEGSSVLQLRNLLGEVIYSLDHKGRINENIDVTTLPAGSYFLSITEDKFITTRKLIIQH